MIAKQRVSRLVVWVVSILVLCLTLATSPPANLQQAPNLVPNSSFESGTGDSPTSWFTQTPDSSIWMSGFAHTGNRSVLIIFSSTASTEATEALVVPGWGSADISVTPAATYTFGFWYLSASTDNFVTAFVLAPEAGFEVEVRGPTFGDSAWHYVEQTIEIPSDVSTVWIYLAGLFTQEGGFASGNAYYDDVYLGQSEDEPGAIIDHFDVSVSPAHPSTEDDITIELSGVWPNDCLPQYTDHFVETDYISIRGDGGPAPGESCNWVESSWSFSVPIGRLDMGEYTIEAHIGIKDGSAPPAERILDFEVVDEDNVYLCGEVKTATECSGRFFNFILDPCTERGVPYLLSVDTIPGDPEQSVRLVNPKIQVREPFCSQEYGMISREVVSYESWEPIVSCSECEGLPGPSPVQIPPDLTNVETWYDGTYAIPGDPDQSLEAWIEFKQYTDGYFFVGIEDQQEQIWIDSWWGWLPAGQYTWNPRWTFKKYPDSYEASIWWWDGDEWSKSDTAKGYIQADKRVQGETGWSPNEYTRAQSMLEWSQEGNDFVSWRQWFWYWDNNYYGDTTGADRLAELKQITKQLTGQLQIEFARQRGVDDESPADGWDAAYVTGIGDLLLVPYGWRSNVPGARADSCTIEETGYGDVCGACFNAPPRGPCQEEAEIVTRETENLTVVSGWDPTSVYEQGYFVEFDFLRKTEYQGQPFTLVTEFEAKEHGLDTAFDIIETVRQDEGF